MPTDSSPTAVSRPREPEGREEVERRARHTLDALGRTARLNARTFHSCAESALRSAGFAVSREVLVSLPKRRRSRIDLVLDGWFAVELDSRAPRLKSLAKILAFGAGMVYCRDPYGDGGS